MVANRRMVTV